MALLDDFKETSLCEGTTCVSARADTPDFVLLFSIFLFLLCRSEILTNLNRSEFLSSVSRVVPTLFSNFFHFLFLRLCSLSTRCIFFLITRSLAALRFLALRFLSSRLRSPRADYWYTPPFSL